MALSKHDQDMIDSIAWCPKRDCAVVTIPLAELAELNTARRVLTNLKAAMVLGLKAQEVALLDDDDVVGPNE